MPLYTGKQENWGKLDPSTLPLPVVDALDDPRFYDPDPDLVRAVDVALTLGQPLLLTGDPGTGKTTLADNVARELSLGRPLKFEVKSTSEARDLFYTFDSLRQFRDANMRQARPEREYIDFQAYGRAILLSLPKGDPAVAEFWDGDEFPGPRRSVVLIDEIDKAPRDFPNDILNEIERGYFRIHEVRGVRVEAGRDFWPVVILTSNSEKHLPDAFLRRCVYHHIDFPKARKLKQIVGKRIESLRRLDEQQRLSNGQVDELIDLFQLLRDPQLGLRRRPGTGELLGAVVALRRRERAVSGSLKQPDLDIDALLNVLLKDKDDLERRPEILDAWRARETPRLEPELRDAAGAAARET